MVNSLSSKCKILSKLCLLSGIHHKAPFNSTKYNSIGYSFLIFSTENSAEKDDGFVESEKGEGEEGGGAHHVHAQQ